MPLLEKRSFRSERSRRRRQRSQIIKTGIGAVIFALLLVLIGVLTRLEAVTLSDVVVEGGETVPHDVVRERVNAALSGTYVLVIPKRFSYMYPHDTILAQVENIPRVSAVWVERPSRKEVKISFTEHEPYALWCDTLDAASSTPQCLFVNEAGYAFGEAPELRGGSMERFVVEGRMPIVGEHVFEESVFRVIDEFGEGLASTYGLRIGSVTETADRDLVFHINGGGDILIARTQPIQEVFDTLVSIFSSEEFSDLTSADFEYIDLRFGNQVYLKEEAVPETEPATTTRAE